MRAFIEILATETVRYAPFPLGPMFTAFLQGMVFQKNEMARIEKKLDQLLVRDFYVGIDFLEQAKISSNQDRALQHFYEAAKNFMRVANTQVERYPILPIKARGFAGVCYYFLKEHDVAESHFQRAVQGLEREFPEALGLANKIAGQMPLYKQQLQKYEKDVVVYRNEKKSYDAALREYQKAIRAYDQGSGNRQLDDLTNLFGRQMGGLLQGRSRPGEWKPPDQRRTYWSGEYRRLGRQYRPNDLKWFDPDGPAGKYELRGYPRKKKDNWNFKDRKPFTGNEALSRFLNELDRQQARPRLTGRKKGKKKQRREKKSGLEERKQPKIPVRPSAPVKPKKPVSPLAEISQETRIPADVVESGVAFILNRQKNREEKRVTSRGRGD